MKKFTIGIEGYGREIYGHPITEKIKNKLSKAGVEKYCDLDQISEITGIENLIFETEDNKCYIGLEQDDYKIIVKECDPDDYYNTDEIYCETDVVSIYDSYEDFYDGDYMFLVNNIKGTIGLYELQLEDDFDESLLGIDYFDLGGMFDIFNTLSYDEKYLNVVDGSGDTKSSSFNCVLL